MTPLELTGRARTHIDRRAASPCLLHEHAAAPFLNMCRAAQADGFEIEAVSGYRDFQRQLAIWNGKFAGDRPLYDAAGDVLDAASMTPAQRVEAILTWSALPGASRHHWGTDVDLIDRRALAPGYRVVLSAAEFTAGGPFAALHQWLEQNAGRFGFFFPYRGILSGVQAEPWHLSFAPVADRARRDLTAIILQEAISDAPLLGKAVVLPRIEELHDRFVRTIDWP